MGRLPAAVVIGANGRSGRGAAALFDALGIEPAKWGRTETRSGGPFPAILNYDILCNCVFLDRPVPPFLTRRMVAARADQPRLSVVADVSNDLSYNPIFGLSAPTKFNDPTVRVGDVDVIEIENLPALTPLDSSLEYSSQLFPHLLALMAGDVARDSVWEKALLTYFQHHDIPHLAMACGRELGELFLAQPGTCGVEYLRTYFCGLFAKNPLSQTDRLFFMDHLMAGAAEVLPDARKEMLAALLAKTNLDCIYDTPAMAAHHALLRTVYDFSRSRAFKDVVNAAAREDFHDLCDALSDIIDQHAGAVEKFIRAKRLLLEQLDRKASDPAFTKFLERIQTLATFPTPCL